VRVAVRAAASVTLPVMLLQSGAPAMRKKTTEAIASMTPARPAAVAMSQDAEHDRERREDGGDSREEPRPHDGSAHHAIVSVPVGRYNRATAWRRWRPTLDGRGSL
jgi:hypothetical protein